VNVLQVLIVIILGLNIQNPDSLNLQKSLAEMTSTPASSRQLTLYRKLNARKYRMQEKMFLAEGERCVEQILENGKTEVIELITEQGYELPVYMQRFGKPVFELTKQDFMEIADTDNPQGVIALCRMPEEEGAEKLIKKSGVILAVDAVQDPGNMGTILRTTSWFGAAGMIAGKGSVDVYHPKVVRSTAGATGALPVLSGDLMEFLPAFEKEGWEIILLDGSDGAEDIRKLPRHEKRILVAGNEANGIQQNLLRSVGKRVLIPGSNEAVESLNVGIAVGVALFSLKS
jgi:TrmH family RNA methyltransferase